MNVDWDAVQIQYEIFHESVENIASENHLTPTMVEYAIAEKGWKRTKLNGKMQQVKDIGDLEDVTDDVLSAVGERLSAINMLKAATMNPRYISLETSILAKAREIVTSIVSAAPNAGDQLKKVTEILEKLRSAGIPQSVNSGASGDKDDGRVIVQILNTVGGTAVDAEPVIEITDGTSAGAR